MRHVKWQKLVIKLTIYSACDDGRYLSVTGFLRKVLTNEDLNVLRCVFRAGRAGMARFCFLVHKAETHWMEITKFR